MRFASSKLQKTMELRAEQQRRATLTQPLICDLQTPSCKRPWKYVRSSNMEQQWRSHPNAIYKQRGAEDHRTTCAQQRGVTLMQPLQCNLQAPEYRSQYKSVSKTEVSPGQVQNQRMSAPKPKKKYDFETFLKANIKGTSTAPKSR